jgi:hypothetical protein
MSRARQPWPMKWILLAILLFIVPYTFITLHYRKPGPAYRPYQDMKDRANVARLLSAGYQRITLTAQRPADPAHPGAAALVTAAPGGVPAGLRSTLIEQPLLPAEILSVAAAPGVNATAPYPIQFTCTLPDNKEQLGGAQLYVRGEELFLLPDFERLTGGLLTRSRENVILLTVPAGALKPGHYQATLVGQHSSKMWTLQVH